ncbi:MAG: helix-turn-helix transcriptional regulator, partial [SAR324 cluster bacterium]|nr:helix-turn-helix transcriptional regulator [SAR324 cluster bacterium]
MGRPKTYDREEIAAKAMELFWLHGFNGTSTQALVEHMQINRYSLYAEFGSKQRLYEVAL